ncbi:hypothetical protein BHE90_010663 [Fusarium euwallaceae]|uniref:Protein kinase domain-containing protein n=4 Tax=Fusarium solani species complex TaxID=232080 RepID=A0A3M2S7K4_9HYPO|nr:hypothetical protein CDV36_006748 [Fusarium kuroshium]RTE74873.1 hypothetical protein BHE90_010663 [Fusarium euwallaceae]
MSTPNPLELPPGVPSYPLELSFRQSEWHRTRLCEWPELYVQGALYPITLGALIKTSSDKPGWYRIIRKLGFGWDWTTWLAQREGVQLEQPQYMTFQIMSESRGTITSIVSLSRDLRASHDGRDPMHVNCPRGYTLEGPNGIHACLAYQPRYTPFSAALHPLTAYPPPSGPPVPRLPVGIIKSILKQTLHGIESMHRAGWVHGAIGVHSLEIKTRSYPEELAQGPEDQVVLEKIRYTSEEAYAPLYLTKVRPLLPRRDDYDEDIKIKLGNLGFAFPAGDIVNRWHLLLGPYQFRAPEMVDSSENDQLFWPSADGIDIWAFGCLVYRLYTGQHILPEISVNSDPELPTF